MTLNTPIRRDQTPPCTRVEVDFSKKQVVEKKKPGLKAGQKIRATRKMQQVQIDAIVRSIKGHALDYPETPLTYQELAEKWKFSTVTLRTKEPIRAAMDEARASALLEREARKAEQEDPGEAAITAEQKLKNLNDELRQIKQEVENYRKDHQLLTLYFLLQGQSLTQVLAQANASMVGKPVNADSTRADPATVIKPISRR